MYIKYVVVYSCNMCVCMYVCIYIYVCVCIYIYIRGEQIWGTRTPGRPNFYGGA